MSDFVGRTSDLLTSLARWPGDTLRIRDIILALGDRGFALLVVLLGLPNCLPMPPPIPLICGILLMVIAIQMLLGLRAPWLPSSLMERQIDRRLVEAATARAMPWLARIERISQPRLAFLQQAIALRLVGAALLCLALGLLVAAPFVGQIPIGLGVCLIGLGLVERDGLLMIAGCVAGAVGLMLSAGFAYAVLQAARALIGF